MTDMTDSLSSVSSTFYFSRSVVIWLSRKLPLERCVTCQICTYADPPSLIIIFNHIYKQRFSPQCLLLMTNLRLCFFFQIGSTSAQDKARQEKSLNSDSSSCTNFHILTLHHRTNYNITLTSLNRDITPRNYATLRYNTYTSFSSD